MLKLGTPVKDNVTDINGILTHYWIDSGANEMYIFQPAALNPETMQPVETMFLSEDRIDGGEQIEVKLPLEVLGSEVEDIATGFKGIAIELWHHINGCNHFGVKPKGILVKTGATIKPVEFDIRRLKGEKIPVLTKAQIVKSQKEFPSPVGHSMHHHS